MNANCSCISKYNTQSYTQQKFTENKKYNNAKKAFSHLEDNISMILIRTRKINIQARNGKHSAIIPC